MSGSSYTNKIDLAHLPTPIQDITNFFNSKTGKRVLIKRDDLTGSVVSGNKIRKLEYLFKHILDSNFDVVISCGGIQSNHARAVAAVCAQLSLECHLILRIPAGETSEQSGNLLLNEMLGAKVHFHEAIHYKDVKLCAEMKAKFEAEGKKAYVIPSGGSNGIGLYGYQNAMLCFPNQKNQSNRPHKIESVTAVLNIRDF